MRPFSLILFSLFTLVALGQDTSSAYATSILASFPGGTDSLNAFVAEHTKFPKRALDNGVGGEVILSFKIDTTGKLYDVQYVSMKYWPLFSPFTFRRKRQKIITNLEKEGDDYDLIEAAKETLGKSPLWVPATKDGKPVEMRFQLPIRFHIFY